MEALERGLQNIDQHTKDAIKKHNDILTKTLFDTAQKSNQSSEKLDLNSKKVFPEATNFGEIDSEAFNPKKVVEFRDGKSFQVIEDWNKIKGILPNRKVMGTYYLDKVLFEVEGISGNNFRHNRRDNGAEIHNLYHINEKTMTIKNVANAAIHTDHYPIPDLSLNKRGENRKFTTIENTYTFQVDNYLNLYHKETSLYFCICEFFLYY